MDQGKMELLRIGADDAVELWKIQVEAFASLYEKYRYTATSPASQDTCRIHQWLKDILICCLAQHSRKVF